MEATGLHVFLSYASADKPLVEELARTLKTRGIEPWLDTWKLIPGTAWQDFLTQALETCQACAVCIGPRGFGQWQTEEINAAIQLQVTTKKGRVIPVLLPGAPREELNALPLFLRGRDWVEFQGKLDDERALRRLIAGIRGEEPGPDEAVAQGACPYRGLKAFDVGDSMFFHGRESLTGRLLAKLQPASADDRFLAVAGPSGSGKSSLARAGLLGSLKNDALPGSQNWPLVVCKPGPQPLESLAVEITRVLRPGDSPTSVLELMRSLGTNPQTLHITTRLALGGAPEDRRVVLLVDQFEEIFSLCGDEAQRQALIGNLLHAAKEPHGQTVVVLTLRSDYLGRCAADAVLAAAISDRLELVGPMAEDELRKAIEEPARLAGLQLEGGLTDLLVGESLGQAGGLPLLEHALLQLWQRRDGLRLTAAAYRDIGGVAGALQRHAEEVFADFTASQQEACKRVFLRLVQVDDQRRATKRRLDVDELIPPGDPEADRKAAQAVVSRLADERLLTTEAAGEERRPTDEVAHEALLSAWKRLGDWIDGDREALWVRHRLDDAVAEWLAKESDPSYLYIGARLAQAEEWSRSHPGELSPSGRKFLAACVAQRDEELTKKRRQRNGIMALLVTVALALGITALYMYRLKKDAEKQRDTNLSALLAGKAETTRSLNPLVSLLLAATAVRLGDLPASRGALMSALARLDSLPLGNAGITAITATADRRWLLTAGKNGKAALWNLAQTPMPAPEDVSPIAGSVDSLALSKDHRWLLVRDREGSVHLRDLGPGGKTTELPPGENWRPGDPFSPDGRWLITHRIGETPVLRDLTGGSPRELTPGPPEILALAFSPDGHHVAVAPKGGPVKMWNLQASNPPAAATSLSGPAQAVQALAFSPDGQWLVAAVQGGNGVDAEAWHVNAAEGTAGEPTPLRGCPGNARIAASPQGAWVVSWGETASSTCLWKLGDTLHEPFLISTAALAAFSSNGQWLASTEPDGTVDLWDLRLPKPTDSELKRQSQGQKIGFLLFAAEDRWLVTQSGDEAPRLWEVPSSSGEILAATPDATWLALGSPDKAVRVQGPGLASPLALQGIEPSSSSSPPLWAFSPDGSWLGEAAGAGKILLWNLAARNPVPQELAVPGSVRALALSPGATFVAAGRDEDAWLWDRRKSQQPVLKQPDKRHTAATALAFDSAATLLAIGWKSGETAEFYLRDLTPRNFPSRDAKVEALAFSPDGKRLAIKDGNGKIDIWSPEKEIPLDSQDKGVDLLVFARDGRSLASGGRKGTGQLWSPDGDHPSGAPVLWQEHTGAFRALSFTAGGKELITACAKGTVRRWPLEPEALIRMACERAGAGRNLTPGEWQRYAPKGEHFRKGMPCGSGK